MKSLNQFLNESYKDDLVKLKSGISVLSGLVIDSIIADNGILKDYNDDSYIAKIEKVESFPNRIDVVYRSYNTKHETGGYKTTAKFYGDLEDIIDNLNYLIFDVVSNKKKKFEDIKIDYKVDNKVSNKHRFENIRNEL
jgi:hypothetical protein